MHLREGIELGNSQGTKGENLCQAKRLYCAIFRLTNIKVPCSNFPSRHYLFHIGARSAQILYTHVRLEVVDCVHLQLLFVIQLSKMTKITLLYCSSFQLILNGKYCLPLLYYFWKIKGLGDVVTE